MGTLRHAPSHQEPSFLRQLHRARGGDKQALEALFERFYPRVEVMVHRSLAHDLRRSRGWLSTRFSTGDVVQEVFRSVLQTLGGFTGACEGEFIAYLARIVRNRLLDAVRFHEAERRDGRRTGSPPEDLVLESETKGPATRASRAEELSIYQEVLRSFPAAERRLLQARLERDLEFPRIAQELGYSSVSACRRAFFSAQGRMIVRLRVLQDGREP